MERKYLILVNGVLWDRKLTKGGALKVIEMLKERGLNAVLGYQYGETIQPSQTTRAN